MEEIDKMKIKQSLVYKNDRFMFVCSTTGIMYQYNIKRGVLLCIFGNSNTGFIKNIATTKDSKYIFTANNNNHVCKWTIHTHQLVGLIMVKDIGKSAFRPMETTNDNKSIFIRDSKCIIKKYNIQTYVIEEEIDISDQMDYKNDIKSFVVTNDDKYLLIDIFSGSVLQYNIRTKEMFGFYRAIHSHCIIQITALHDSKYLFTCADNRELKQWDLETRQ